MPPIVLQHFIDMGILNKIKHLFSRSAQAEHTATAATATTRGGGFYLFQPSQSVALQVAAVYRCVRVLADSVACLKLQYMKQKDGVYVEDTASPLHYLLTVEPQPEKSAMDFWAEAVEQMLLDGNAYIYPRRVMGELTDLVLCGSGTVVQDAANGKYSIADTVNGVYGVFPESDIIHLYLHYNQTTHTGESVLSHARRTIGIAQAGDEETVQRFDDSGTVRGLITNDKSVRGFGEYQDEQLVNAATDVDNRFRNGERIVSLPGEVDFKQVSLSPADMQFLESRKFTVREVCRFFGVHPSFVFDDTSNNYKSAEMANVAFLSMTLNPILMRIENELRRKLIPRSKCCRQLFRFDRKGIYSLDLAALADYQLKTIQSGIYTVNDWREAENRPKVADGDRVLVSTNLMPIDQLGKNGENTGKTNEPSKNI